MHRRFYSSLESKVRLLLDENLPRSLTRLLGSHEVTTVAEAGWAGTKNGELLRLADGTFDVLLTADKNLRYQQNLAHRRIAIVEIFTNRRQVLEAHAHRLVALLDQVKPGAYLFLLEDK
jgi:hypothetical protein